MRVQGDITSPEVRGDTTSLRDRGDARALLNGKDKGCEDQGEARVKEEHNGLEG